MRFHLFAGGLEMNEGATCGEWGNFERAAQNFGAFAHGDEADAGLAFGGTKTFAMIFDFKNQGSGFELQANPGFFGAGMPSDIVERFLKDAIDLDAGGCSHGVGFS